MPPEEHLNHLFSSIYPDLRKMAAARMYYGQTIQPTALVHEAWLRLSAHPAEHWWDDRRKLLAATTVTMRRILIDRARKRSQLKQVEPLTGVLLDDTSGTRVDSDERLLLIDEILKQLELDNPSYARVVILKIFCGLSFAEIAEEMQSSERTVYRLWKRAKARIYEEFIHRQ